MNGIVRFIGREWLLVAVLSLLALSGTAGPGNASGNDVRRLSSDTTQLAVLDQDGGTLARLPVHVASTPVERYLGLSGTTRLDTGAGLWFVYTSTDTRTFVMRNMNYPLDIVFVDGDNRITAVESAAVEDDYPLTKYQGRARWVLEVNRGWARRLGVATGDRLVEIETSQ